MLIFSTFYLFYNPFPCQTASVLLKGFIGHRHQDEKHNEFSRGSHLILDSRKIVPEQKLHVSPRSVCRHHL